jgi:hypothetical protein
MLGYLAFSNLLMPVVVTLLDCQYFAYIMSGVGLLIQILSVSKTD